MDDLRVALDALHEQILDHVDPLRILEELFSHNFQSLVLGLDLREFFVDTLGSRCLRRLLAFLHRFREFLVEVDSIVGSLLKLVILDLSLDFISHSSIVLSDSLRVELKRLKLTVPVSGQCHTLLFFPDLDKTLNCSQGEFLLLISEFSILAHRVNADDVL